MNSYVLDTSVTIAWYLDESFSLAARAWQERLLQGKVTLIVPSLHYWEFANALRSLVSRKILQPDLAREIYDLHLDAPLDKIDPPADGILDVALKYRATAYDSVFIALSLAQDIPLVTAERTTTAWVARLGERVEVVR